MDEIRTSYWNTALADAASRMTLSIHRIACGTYVGHWKNHFPVNRLIYIFNGSAEPSRIRGGGVVFEMLPGRWLLIPCGHAAEHDQHEGLRLISIHFSLERLPGIDYLAECTGFHMGVAPGRKQDFANLMNPQSSLAEAALLRKTLWDVLLPVIRGEGERLERQAIRVNRFQDLFAAFASEPRRDFTVDEMAGIMGMGKVSFIKHFTAETGHPPKEFFHRMRAAAAARELLATDDSIREIAARFHFSDEFYFSRFMKRMTGLSPRAYRRSILRRDDCR